jgi:hypothetical protein
MDTADQKPPVDQLAAEKNQRKDQLLSNTKEAYGDRFQDHLLEQYKLFVDSSLRVSEKRISTGNYLLTVSSSLMTVFGIATTLQVGGRWLSIIPIAGLLVSLTWFSLIRAYKDLNTAKFKVIHELEDYLPVALFRYEWHSCDLGKGKTYKPITHLERWIPLIFAAVYLALTAYTVASWSTNRKSEPQPVSVSGSVDINIKPPAKVAQPGE